MVFLTMLFLFFFYSFNTPVLTLKKMSIMSSTPSTSKATRFSAVSTYYFLFISNGEKAWIQVR